MLADASKQNPPIVFNQVFPGSSNIVVNKYPVEGAFSKGGFASFQKELNNIDRYISGETWVLGPKATAPQDKTELAAQIERFYTDDFIKAWRGYLNATRFAGYRDVPDAAKKLTQMQAISRRFWRSYASLRTTPLSRKRTSLTCSSPYSSLLQKVVSIGCSRHRTPPI